MQLFEWRVIPLWRLIFLIFWKPTGKQMVVYHSELTILSYSRHNCRYNCDMSSYSKKTGDHLLGSASCASNFCWIWLILKPPYSRLLFTFAFIHVNAWFITCHERLTNCVGSNANIFFWQSNIHACIECMLIPLMPKVVSISREKSYVRSLVQCELAMIYACDIIVS